MQFDKEASQNGGNCVARSRVALGISAAGSHFVHARKTPQRRAARPDLLRLGSGQALAAQKRLARDDNEFSKGGQEGLASVYSRSYDSAHRLGGSYAEVLQVSRHKFVVFFLLGFVESSSGQDRDRRGYAGRSGLNSDFE